MELSPVFLSILFIIASILTPDATFCILHTMRITAREQNMMMMHNRTICPRMAQFVKICTICAVIYSSTIVPGTLNCTIVNHLVVQNIITK